MRRLKLAACPLLWWCIQGPSETSMLNSKSATWCTLQRLVSWNVFLIFCGSSCALLSPSNISVVLHDPTCRSWLHLQFPTARESSTQPAFLNLVSCRGSVRTHHTGLSLNSIFKQWLMSFYVAQKGYMFLDARIFYYISKYDWKDKQISYLRG